LLLLLLQLYARPCSVCTHINPATATAAVPAALYQRLIPFLLLLLLLLLQAHPACATAAAGFCCKLSCSINTLQPHTMQSNSVWW
jgi:hypothetical protein